MNWLTYLREQRAEKLARIDALETGTVQLSKTVDDLTTDITAEELARLKSEVAEIRRIFIEEGITPDA